MDWRLQILGALATALVAILTAAAPIVARLVVRYLEQRMRIDLSEAEEQALANAVADAASWAEEQAQKAAKANGLPWTSAQKMDAAKAMAREILGRHGRNLDDAAIAAGIESWVNRVRGAR